MKQHPINVNETEIRAVMTGFLQDLGKLGGAKPHPKWVTWMDKGLEVGEWR
jgi:hypothetical protein